MYEGPIKYFITHRLSCLETCPEGLSSKGKAIRWVMKAKRYLVNSRIYMILQKPYRGILASIETESNVQQQCYSILEISKRDCGSRKQSRQLGTALSCADPSSSHVNKAQTTQLEKDLRVQQKIVRWPAVPKGNLWVLQWRMYVIYIWQVPYKRGRQMPSRNLIIWKAFIN